jgi:hypothetical protein
MTRADLALIVQAVASIAAAIAAFFAWRTARWIRQEQEAEQRFRWSQQLKNIHRLLTLLGDRLHKPLGETLAPWLELRAELVVVPVPLPKCLALADPEEGRVTVESSTSLPRMRSKGWRKL